MRGKPAFSRGFAARNVISRNQSFPAFVCAVNRRYVPMADKENYEILEIIAARSIKGVTSSRTLIIVFALFGLWLAAGPFLDFSAEWQLTMGTVSAATTFLMVFLLTRVQAKDSQALQIKLNE